MKKMKTWKGNFLRRMLSVPTAAVLALCLIAAAAAGIVLAASGSTPEVDMVDENALAGTLVSEGVTYDRATVLARNKGRANQYATFTGLPDGYGFSDGIILSNGRTDKAFTSYATWELGSDYDEFKDHSGIEAEAYRKLRETYASYCKQAGATPKEINDAAIFAIKLTPTTNALSFQYFFASNEYGKPAAYNDPFALWVVQGFDRDKGEDGTWTNIAKIPEDRKPEGAKGNEVNIQNTCPGFKIYKNIPGIYKYNRNKTIGYLGCTEALDAEIDTLTPWEPVWVVMAVGDAWDYEADSALFIKAKSLRFSKVGDVNITYEANGGTFDNGKPKAVKSVKSGSAYQVGEDISIPTRKEYVFDGWYTNARDGQKVSGDNATAEKDTTYYAHWKPVTSTVTVPVKKDGGAMPAGTAVELRQNGATAYTFTQSGTFWTVAGVRNGVYQVYVDGEDAERSVTVNAESQGQTFSADAINYYTVTANVTLDGKAWSGQTVALSDGTPLTGDGPYTAVLREKTSGNSYTVWVRGEDKGTVTVTASGKKSVTDAYHTIQVTVSDTTAWTDASVVLRRNGSDAHRLAYNSATGKYEIILPGTDTAEYDVFVEGRDVGKTVSISSKTAEADFYTASVKITGGFANMPVSITNGTDSYTLTGGNTSGTVYTCKHVFKRGGAGYAITVGGTVGTVTDKITGSVVVNLTYYTVTFKNSGGGTHITQYVLNGTQAQKVSVPIKEGSVALGWSATSGATAADFSFSTAVTAAKTLYPVYEAAGIRLGAHIQTGDRSAYTYQLPNLTIRGYSSVSTVVLTVKNCSDVTVESGMTKTTSLDADGNGTVILKFDSGTTGAAAQAMLRSMTVKVKNVTKNHTIRATVYGGQH